MLNDIQVKEMMNEISKKTGIMSDLNGSTY